MSSSSDSSRQPASLRVLARLVAAWWDNWLGVATINLACTLCWLTIILGPPATFGVVYATNRMVHGESVDFGLFVEGLRRYFVKGWIWAGLNGLAFFLVTANLSFYGQLESVLGAPLQWLSLLLLALWLMAQLFGLPFLMEQTKESLLLALRNGLYTTLAAPGFALVLAAVALLLLVLSVLTIAPFLVGGPTLAIALGNQAVLERLETFGLRPPPDSETPAGA